MRPRVKLIGAPVRLVVDLPGITLGQPRSQKAIGSYVQQVRIGQFNPQTTRIVVALGSQYTLRPQDVQVQGLAPNRWFVQLPKLQPLHSQLPLPPDGVPIQTPSPRPYPKARVVIAIDPGHGGADVGAVGIGGIQEKWIVLDMARRVSQQLARRGVQAVLTRSGDEEIDLAPRVAKAARIRARAFVSIHANAISLNHPQVNGLETYYYATGYPLARLIHSSILNRIPMVDRGVKRARFYVLRYTSMPAVLVETGFVTGRQDARNLANSAFRARMAEAIAEGILRYFKL